MHFLLLCCFSVECSDGCVVNHVEMQVNIKVRLLFRPYMCLKELCVYVCVREREVRCAGWPQSQSKERGYWTGVRAAEMSALSEKQMERKCFPLFFSYLHLSPSVPHTHTHTHRLGV